MNSTESAIATIARRTCNISHDTVLNRLQASTFLAAQLPFCNCWEQTGDAFQQQREGIARFILKNHHCCGRSEGGGAFPHIAHSRLRYTEQAKHLAHQPRVPQTKFWEGFPGMHRALSMAQCQKSYSEEIIVLETCFSDTVCFLFNNFKAKEFLLVVVLIFLLLTRLRNITASDLGYPCKMCLVISS